MMLNKEETKELAALSEPLVDFITANCHPHVSLTITPEGVTLNEVKVFVPLPEK